MSHYRDVMSRSFPTDPHSHARPNEIAVRHLGLDLTVDFERRRLTGLATLELERRSPEAAVVVLDTWHLDVAAVTLGDGTHLLYELGEHDPALGRSLTIHVGSTDTEVVVHCAGRTRASGSSSPSHSRSWPGAGSRARTPRPYGSPTTPRCRCLRTCSP